MHTPGVRWPAWPAAVLLAATLFGRASAQTSGSLRLSSPATEAFPTIKVFLDVRDDQGRRVAGLRADGYQPE